MEIGNNIQAADGFALVLVLMVLKLLSIKHNLNSAILANQTISNDGSLTICNQVWCSWKTSVSGLQFKLRVKYVTSNTNNFSASPLFTLDTNYSESPMSLLLMSPETTSIQFQLICGGAVGTYYFDDFSASLTTLNFRDKRNFLKFTQPN